MSIAKTSLLFVFSLVALTASSHTAWADIFSPPDYYTAREQYMSKTPGMRGDVSPQPVAPAAPAAVTQPMTAVAPPPPTIYTTDPMPDFETDQNRETISVSPLAVGGSER